MVYAEIVGGCYETNQRIEINEININNEIINI
jgi:hypothetical protein